MPNTKQKITLDRIVAMVERDDMEGICIACGSEQGNVEPDARRYPCEACGQRKVYGAEMILLMVSA